MLNRYLDVFASLNSQGVRYVVIGGIAAIIHGVPRATFDLDMLIEATTDNATKLLEAFEAANLGTALLTTPEELVSQEITIFRDRVRIDVQTRTPGTEFDGAWQRRETLQFNGVTIQIISLDDLIATKKAAGREVDLSDVALLEHKLDGEPNL
jgi:predicted nucleotidyltransferase